MKVQTNIEFTEMKKNKKESLKFTLKGDDKDGIGKRLYDLAGSIVHMAISGCEVGTFPAEFVDIKKSAKGVVANFLLKGDLSDEESGTIYAYSGGTSVTLSLESSQMTIEDFHKEEHEGIAYTIDGDGNVNADPDQLNMDEVVAAQEAAPASEEAPAAVSTSKRKTKAEKDAEKAAAALLGDDDDALLETVK